MKKLPSDSIIRAGFFILLANAIYNAFNFFYHFMAARMLGPEQYAIVASLFSIIYLISMGSMTIQNSATKFISKFRAKGDYESIGAFFKKGSRKLLWASFGLALIFLILSYPIAIFLKIPWISVINLLPIIILSVTLPLNRGVMQGLQKFTALGWNMIAEGGLKFILAFILIYFGLKANSAIMAVSIALIIAFALTFFSLRFTAKGKNVKIDARKIYGFSFLTLIALTFLTAVYSIDVFLVKHFFDATTAGHYAALSLLGKIVFFGGTAIGLVMFPKISETHEIDKKIANRILKKSLLFTIAISGLATLVYFVFSKLIVNIIFGADYLDIVPLMGWFGISMTLLSLSYVYSLYNLAIGKKKFILNIGIAVLMEIFAIWLFHNSLAQIVISLNVINLLLSASLIVKK